GRVGFLPRLTMTAPSPNCPSRCGGPCSTPWRPPPEQESGHREISSRRKSQAESLCENQGLFGTVEDEFVIRPRCVSPDELQIRPPTTRGQSRSRTDTDDRAAVSGPNDRGAVCGNPAGGARTAPEEAEGGPLAEPPQAAPQEEDFLGPGRRSLAGS